MTRRVFNSFEILILRELIYGNNKNVNIYSLHDKYLLSPGQISKFVLTYLDKKIITFENHCISLTSKGKSWLVKNKDTLFLGAREREWAEIPEEFKYDEYFEMFHFRHLSDKEIKFFKNIKGLGRN